MNDKRGKLTQRPISDAGSPLAPARAEAAAAGRRTEAGEELIWNDRLISIDRSTAMTYVVSVGESTTSLGTPVRKLMTVGVTLSHPFSR